MTWVIFELQGTIGFISQGGGLGSIFFFELPLYSAERVTRDDVKSSKLNLFTLNTAVMSTSMISMKGFNDIPRVFPSVNNVGGNVDVLHTSSQLLENDLSVISCTREDLEQVNTSLVFKRQNSYSDTIFGEVNIFNTFLY